MEQNKKTYLSPSRTIKPWKFIFILLINVIIFIVIGFIYFSYSKNTELRLFNENINNVNNMNASSAASAYSYTQDMGIKLEDTISFIQKNNLNFEQTLNYLADSNTNPARQFQLVLCGTYGSTGELRYGDYSGFSIRKRQLSNKSFTTLKSPIIYGSGYYDILRAFTDIHDTDNTTCFIPEFTDPDTKTKCFAVYRHVSLIDSNGKKNIYVVLLAVNSQTALNTYSTQNTYQDQFSVLVNEDGTYLIKNNNFRNNNFYDYIVNYNGLTLDWKAKLQSQVSVTTNKNNTSANLFYKNHKGEDCVFSIIRIENGWYNITSTPIASFNLEDKSINYSFIILVLFIILFVVDAIVVYLVGKVMNYNTSVAKSASIAANEASLAKSRFLSTMSHELRTPLNAIIGFVSLSKDTLDDIPQLKDYLSKIEISSKLLLQLISDILDISAIESNKIKLTSSTFDIAKLITSLSTIYYDQCAKKNIDFNVILRNIYSETLIGDSIRVNQILLNLLSNAVKFTPSNGKITLKVESVSQSESIIRIRFTISDTGCGINDELKSRLFKPFERALGEKAVKFSGTGLGLSISKSITELMNGEIGVESVEGSGSTFWAEIPFTVAIKPQERHYSPLNNLKILAAINNDEEREYIGQIFTNIGTEYRLTNNITSTIALLDEEQNNKKPFNMCIIDWKLSDLNAFDAVTAIRVKFPKQQLIIIVLSYDLAEAKQKCLTAGANQIFCKPVFSSSLYNLLEELTTNSSLPIPETTSNYDLNGHRVLLVEDNKFNIEVAQRILQKFKLSVVTAKNGKEGFDFFISSTPGYFDLILMDIQMPIMNGYESTQAIRTSNHTDAKKIPILAMTADAFSEDVDKAFEAGMNEHISKPIEPDNLYKTIKSYLK